VGPGFCVRGLVKFLKFGWKMRTPGIEPGAQAWEACMLPLHYERVPKIERIFAHRLTPVMSPPSEKAINLGLFPALL
jgi:hypothetical protein